MKHMGRITPQLFERWLSLWAETTNAMMEPSTALALQDKAGRIAESLQLALFFRIDGPRCETRAVGKNEEASGS